MRGTQMCFCSMSPWSSLVTNSDLHISMSQELTSDIWCAGTKWLFRCSMSPWVLVSRTHIWHINESKTPIWHVMRGIQICFCFISRLAILVTNSDLDISMSHELTSDISMSSKLLSDIWCAGAKWHSRCFMSRCTRSNIASFCWRGILLARQHS